jgi:hypothetical protein
MTRIATTVYSTKLYFFSSYPPSNDALDSTEKPNEINNSSPHYHNSEYIMQESITSDASNNNLYSAKKASWNNLTTENAPSKIV